MRPPVLLLVAAMLLAATGCSRSTAEASGAVAETDSYRPIILRAPKRPVIEVPEGTSLEIRLEQAVTTARNRTGDSFEASLASPVVVDGKIAIPEGAQLRGLVRDAKPSARSTGRAVLTLTLSSLYMRGKTHPLETNSKTSSTNRRAKGNLLWVGGGSNMESSSIKALVPGKKHIGIPPEAVMTFRLQKPLLVGG